jgi:hypothetical protein
LQRRLVDQPLNLSNEKLVSNFAASNASCTDRYAAAALLRVAYRELRKIGFFGGGAEDDAGAADDAGSTAGKSPTKAEGEIPP